MSIRVFAAAGLRPFAEMAFVTAAAGRPPRQLGLAAQTATSRTRPMLSERPGIVKKRDLTDMHILCILIHMRTTLNIDDELIRKAAKMTGVSEKTSLVRLGLEALIALESARRLAALGGTEKDLGPVRRRRASS